MLDFSRASLVLSVSDSRGIRQAALLSAMPHPFEWLMAGAAVALAFLLTLALSEHLGFALP